MGSRLSEKETAQIVDRGLSSESHELISPPGTLPTEAELLTAIEVLSNVCDKSGKILFGEDIAQEAVSHAYFQMRDGKKVYKFAAYCWSIARSIRHRQKSQGWARSELHLYAVSDNILPAVPASQEHYTLLSEMADQYPEAVHDALTPTSDYPGYSETHKPSGKKITTARRILKKFAEGE